MKGVTSWSYAPYRPLMWDVGEIYICRLYPGVEKIGMDWLPLEGTPEYHVFLRPRGSEVPYTEYKTSGTSLVIDGLADDTDYEFFIEADGQKSRLRLARTGFVPGDTVVNYLHPDDTCYAYSGNYLCSPSLVRHPDGYLLASMDVFRGNYPQNLSLIFRSDDEGASWQYVSELYPCFWGKLFIHKGELYMLSVSTEYGDLLIGKSTDGGRHFDSPAVLLRGSSGFKQPGVHKNPQKVLSYNGRLWITLEWGSWASGTHAAMVGSVSEDADLLDAGNWRFSYPTPYDPNWEGAAKGNSAGCLEGCLTVDPKGSLLNVMRYQTNGCEPSYGLACAMKIFPEEPDRALEFDHMIKFPGNLTKFEIHYDEMSGCYLSVVSYLCAEHTSGRNWLALIASKDMEKWEKVTDLFNYSHRPEGEVGFQYVNFLIEGDDLLYLSRTAFNHAANFHDSNYSVFSRLKDFRKLLKQVL